MDPDLTFFPLGHLVLQIQTYLWKEMRVKLLHLVPEFPSGFSRTMVLPLDFHPVYCPSPENLFLRVDNLRRSLNIGNIWLQFQWLILQHVRWVCDILLQHRDMKNIIYR